MTTKNPECTPHPACLQGEPIVYSLGDQAASADPPLHPTQNGEDVPERP
jgi:hypothetical protein